MDLRRVPAVLALIGATVVLAGCYGSTEPATNITVDSATLHGKGTADQGSTPVWFQYWPTAHPDQVTKLDVQTFGDETGPVSKGTHTLAIATNYSFRMCGSDRTTPPQGVCAQTRTFTTLQPAGDLVRGGFITQYTGSGHNGGVDASSDTAGGHPDGTMVLPAENSATGGIRFSGHVTCVRVNGNRAAVGAVGSMTHMEDGTPDGGPATTALLEVIDVNEGFAGDQVGYTETPGSAPPNCSSATFTDVFTPLAAELNVYDHP